MKRILLNVFCLAVLGLFASAPARVASPDCGQVKGAGSAAGATLEHLDGGVDLEGGRASVTLSLAEVADAEGGAKQARMSLRLGYDDGSSLAAGGQAQLVPADAPGKYRFTQPLSISEGARGQLMLRGEIDLDNREAKFEISGSVCR